MSAPDLSSPSAPAGRVEQPGQLAAASACQHCQSACLHTLLAAFFCPNALAPDDIPPATTHTQAVKTRSPAPGLCAFCSSGRLISLFLMRHMIDDHLLVFFQSVHAEIGPVDWGREDPAYPTDCCSMCLGRFLVLPGKDRAADNFQALSGPTMPDTGKWMVISPRRTHFSPSIALLPASPAYPADFLVSPCAHSSGSVSGRLILKVSLI